jgi:hypothetical protein
MSKTTRIQRKEHVIWKLYELSVAYHDMKIAKHEYKNDKAKERLGNRLAKLELKS